ncbi:hypothetical protein F8M41_021780 [Gigaspora margarita]|uniref:Uncharacterized protein n=1 Tax=Gigaspora margarita TaxID=4874 RepID=A0A8H4B1E3_GIGMA|nr:hypothetical protein F8M41_021780 [Gigaspora margarita]
MNNELEKELHCFINEIINSLNAEKCQTTNEIDQLIEKQNNSTNKTKKSLKCFNKSIIFKPYEPTNSSIRQQEPEVSITQETVMNQSIKIPDLYIPDPIPVNSNSLANVQKVLEHIEIIAGIKSE